MGGGNYTKEGTMSKSKRERYSAEFKARVALGALKGEENLVGICQSISGYFAPDAHVVELVLLCTQTGVDIPQTFSVGQLGKGHAEKLIQAGKFLYFVVAMISY